MDKKSNLSANIKFIRESNNLNQVDFGKIIDKGASLVSAYEKGVSTPPLSIIQIISKKFNYSLDDLVNIDLYSLEKSNNNGRKYNNNGDLDKIIEEKINNDDAYAVLSEINYLKEKSPDVLKNENKLFMISYRQRVADSLLLLFSLCKILWHNNYKFTKKEIEDLEYYDDLMDIIKNIEKGEIQLTNDLKVRLINILDNSLLGLITKYTYKVDMIYKDNIIEWEDLLISKQ